MNVIEETAFVNAKIERIVIIGAGHAGGEAAMRLRQLGFAGDVTVIGAEAQAPYQRPPLSKAYLLGELSLERLLLRPLTTYNDERITLILNRKVQFIDRAGKNVRIEGGRVLPYDALILATGSRARTLPLAGADLPGVHLLRTVEDVDAIRANLQPGARLGVIGAGYIGLEVAAIARKLNAEVTVIEAAERPLARVTSPEVAGFFLDQHVAHGVRFELGAQAAVLKGDDRVRAIGLADGGEVACDIVIAGIGVLPETGLAETAGLQIQNGVAVDADMRTSDPAIFAIGDCVSRPMVHYRDRRARLESVHNAIEGAKIAAAALMGQPRPTEEAPWFWSDQYDLKLQIAGLFNGYDQIVMRGDMAEKSFAAFYLKAGRLIAVDAVNRPGEYLGAKQLIQRGASIAPTALADLSRPFKAIMTEAV
jgi:3-phenylpropionate/trans-cinnamate dioxygenase ferredoxin reductase subunit